MRSLLYLLDFRDGFEVALAGVIEGAAKYANLSTSIDDGHAVVHGLDDLKKRVEARCFGGGFHEAFGLFLSVKILENIIISAMA